MENYFVIIRKDENIVWSGEFIAKSKIKAMKLGSDYYFNNVAKSLHEIEISAYVIRKGNDDNTMAFRIALNSKYGI